jgi:hypothetical protein
MIRRMLQYLFVMGVGRMEGMKARLAELERTRPEYRGIWKARTMYARGSFVTSAGSVWCATEDTDSKPGSDATWTLAVKRGRDGKHASRAMERE